MEIVLCEIEWGNMECVILYLEWFCDILKDMYEYLCGFVWDIRVIEYVFFDFFDILEWEVECIW